MEDEPITIPDVIAGFPVHAMARAYPSMSKVAFGELKTSLDTYGQKEPVRVWNKYIIDGTHRALALEQLGKPPLISELECSETEAVQLSFILNAERRHLTTVEKAFAVLEFEKRIGSALTSDLKNGRTKSRRPTRAGLAKRIGTTSRTVQKVAAISRQAIPDVSNAARSNRISIDEALLISAMPMNEQYAAYQQLISSDQKGGKTTTCEAKTSEPSRTEMFDIFMDFLLEGYQSFDDVLPILQRDPISFVNELGDMIEILVGIRDEALSVTSVDAPRVAA